MLAPQPSSIRGATNGLAMNCVTLVAASATLPSADTNARRGVIDRVGAAPAQRPSAGCGPRRPSYRPAHLAPWRHSAKRLNVSQVVANHERNALIRDEIGVMLKPAAAGSGQSWKFDDIGKQLSERLLKLGTCRKAVSHDSATAVLEDPYHQRPQWICHQSVMAQAYRWI